MREVLLCHSTIKLFLCLFLQLFGSQAACSLFLVPGEQTLAGTVLWRDGATAGLQCTLGLVVLGLASDEDAIHHCPGVVLIISVELGSNHQV